MCAHLAHLAQRADVAEKAPFSKRRFIVEFPRGAQPSYIDAVNALLDLMMTFPTVLFAALSAVSLLYWCLVIVGAADMDALDGLTGKAHGVVDGAIDAVTGAAKGGTSALAEALAAMGLSKVPITISASIFGLLGFFLSVTTHHLLREVLPLAVTSLVATVVSVVGAGAATVVAVRPLRGLFTDGATRGGGRSLLGRTVVITIEADQTSGQARTNDEVIVSVRCVTHALQRGEEAVIMDLADDGVFIVEPMRAIMPSTADAFAGLEAAERDERETADAIAASASASASTTKG